MQKVLKLAGAGNLTLSEYKLQLEMSDAEIDKAKEWWLPQLLLGSRIHTLSGTTMNAIGRFNDSVTRQNAQTGLDINASWNIGDGIYKKQVAVYKSQAKRYESKAARNNMLLACISTYSDFLTAQFAERAIRELLLQSEIITKQLNIQVEAGMRLASEALLAKASDLQLKIQLLQEEKRKNIFAAQLKELLNLNPSIELSSSDTMLSPIKNIDEKLYDNLNEEGYALAAQNRYEIKSMQRSLLASEAEKNIYTKSYFFPIIQLSNNSGLFGDIFSPANPTNELNAAITWRIPVNNFLHQGDLKRNRAKIGLAKIGIAQFKARVNREITQARANINGSLEQLSFAKEATETSALALSQSFQRQELGTIQPLELLQAQQIYIRSKIEYLRAVGEYNKAHYALYVALGNDL